jgi:hypothetical protein
MMLWFSHALHPSPAVCSKPILRLMPAVSPVVDALPVLAAGVSSLRGSEALLVEVAQLLNGCRLPAVCLLNACSLPAVCLPYPCACCSAWHAAGVNSLRGSEPSLVEVTRLLEVPAELLAEEVAQVRAAFCEQKDVLCWPVKLSTA